MSNRLMLIDERQGLLLRRGRLTRGRFFAFPNGNTLIDIGKRGIYQFSPDNVEGIGLYVDVPHERNIADIELPMKGGHFVRGSLVDYTPGDPFLLLIFPEFDWESCTDWEELEEDGGQGSADETCEDAAADPPALDEDVADDTDLEPEKLLDGWNSGDEEPLGQGDESSSLVVQDADEQEDLNPFVYCQAAFINRQCIDLNDSELAELLRVVAAE